MSTAKEVMENLARAKGYFHRHDVPRAVLALAHVLKEFLESPQIVGRDKQTIQMTVAELAQLLGRTEEAQEFMLEGLLYERGKEKSFLKDCATFYKRLDAAAKAEQEAQTQARKLRMDRLMLRGGKFLAAGRLAEALQCYDEAASLHHDEDIIFTMIGRRLLEAEASEAALPWLAKAVATKDANITAWLAYGQALKAQNRIEDAAQACRDGLERLGPRAELHLLLAQLEEQAGRKPEALSQYAAALEQPDTDSLVRGKALAGRKRLGAS
ncbi:tetratricopeptide repeat protein [Megalodesulfovibrio gigas]|uniref:tetratricopeptide repeat protein n=1 Tax=Megalodesulfovibrio gigas TaxID=879 RepID=UPI000A40D615|nr:tetratricopeptide repeat protein [Megalodesulfovibrio gigas]